MITNLSIVLGNQLIKPSLIPEITKFPIFMCESDDLCTHFKYHKLKIIFFLTAMREYHKELSDKNIDCFYHKLSPTKTQNFLDVLSDFCKKNQVKHIHTLEIEDLFFEDCLSHFCSKMKIKLTTYKSPLFITTRTEFNDYIKSTKKPFMKTFYEQQRRKLNLLIENNQPIGGKFSFDKENRKKTPKDLILPNIPKGTNSLYLEEVKKLVTKKFSDHIGDIDHCWFPTSRKEAHDWCNNFIEHRLNLFGDYEDAIDTRCDFLFHSAMSPIINCGLITPLEIIDKVRKVQDKIPLNSLEGFIRQIIGWREFIRGIYQNYDHIQEKSNFFNHTNQLTSAWYSGSTTIIPLDHAIQQVMKLGYTHHINRLMVIGNMMLMCKIHPKESYRWFMECFIDSSDWVMGPNVYGMSQFSDGGIFATKPYLCGSNYIRKMSHFKKGDWCDYMDALYWRFIADNENFFMGNFRMKFMVSKIKSFSKDKLDSIYSLSDDIIGQLTTSETKMSNK